jgi:hypothetical protein
MSIAAHEEFRPDYVTTAVIFTFFLFFFPLQDAYAEPGQDSRNIAGIDIVVIVEDVQDVAPVFTMAPPVTRLPPGLIPGDKVS